MPEGAPILTQEKFFEMGNSFQHSLGCMAVSIQVNNYEVQSLPYQGIPHPHFTTCRFRCR